MSLARRCLALPWPHMKWSIVALLCLSSLALAACGDSETESAASEPAGKTAASSGPAEYDGVQKDLPASFEDPEPRPGKSLTVGYLQIYGSLPVLALEQRGAEEKARELGVELIVKDAQLNPQTQVSQFNQMLAQGVDAVVVYPVVPESLGPALAKAKSAGIPVISTNARPDVSKPLPKGYTADVEQTLDHEAYSMAKAMAEAQPGAKFGIVGLALPVQALKYLAAQQRYWGEQFGLEFVGQVDAKQDTPTAYGPAVNELLSKSPEIQQIFTFNDAVALTASTVTRSSGKPDIKIASASGTEKAALEAIKAGRIEMGYQMPWAETGAQMLIGAYNAATDQNLPLPETIGLRGKAITKANAAESRPSE
jgi:ribose transport system substrate-binding protein